MSKIHTAGFNYFFCNNCNNFILPGQEYRQSWGKRCHIRPDCEHAGSVIFYDPVPLLDEKAWRCSSGRHYRMLRSYTRIADKDYSCWRCEHSKSVNQQSMSVIFAGTQYDAEVWVTKWGFEVRRLHPLCPWEPDWDYELLEYEDEDVEDVVEEEWSLPLAA